jgi:hypothetical protein
VVGLLPSNKPDYAARSPKTEDRGLLTASYPAMARPYHGHHHATCEKVRAYVAQIGLAQAVAMA